MNLHRMKGMDFVREVQDLRDRILVLEESSLRKDSIIHKTLLQASVTDTSVDAVMVPADAGDLMAGNGTAEILFGCTYADVHGHHVCMLFPANNQENLWKIHRKGLPSGLGKRRGELPQKVRAVPSTLFHPCPRPSARRGR